MQLSHVRGEVAPATTTSEVDVYVSMGYGRRGCTVDYDVRSVACVTHLSTSSDEKASVRCIGYGSV